LEAALSHIRIRVAGLLVKDGQILLVRHEKNGKSYWLLPGGGVDFGETAEEALIREFKEEVGLDIQVGKLVFVHDSIPPDRHRQVLNLYFLTTAGEQEIKVTPDAVLRDAAYYPLSEFPKMRVNPDIKAQILEGLAQNWPGGCRYLGNEWKD
jgi:ADP-ribose pyrophosphatase YjhB (NUDIX family)